MKIYLLNPKYSSYIVLLKDLFKKLSFYKMMKMTLIASTCLMLSLLCIRILYIDTYKTSIIEDLVLSVAWSLFITLFLHLTLPIALFFIWLFSRKKYIELAEGGINRSYGKFIPVEKIENVSVSKVAYIFTKRFYAYPITIRGYEKKELHEIVEKIVKKYQVKLLITKNGKDRKATLEELMFG